MSLLDKATIITTPTAHSEGKLHSIKGGSVADFDVVRGSAATRVNAEGLIEDIRVIGDEEIANGDFSNGSTDWTIENTWTIGDGVANGNGANGSEEELAQSFSIVSGKTYKVVYDVLNYVSGSVRFQFSVGGTVSGTTRLSDGTFTEYVVASGNHTTFKFRPSNFNGSITNISVKEVIDATNIPRIDYTTGEGVLLLEPQSTNLIPYSEDFSNAYWTKNGSSVVGGFTSPSVDLTAFKLVESALNERHRIRLSSSFSVSVATSLSQSVFVKSDGRTKVAIKDNVSSSQYASFDLATGSFIDKSSGSSFSIKEMSDGFYKISNTYTTIGTTTGFEISILDDTYTGGDPVGQTYQGDGVSGLYIWGAQLEALSHATSYIPTSGAIATRLADSVTGAGDASTFNSTEGTLYFEGSALVNGGVNRYISLSDNTSSNRRQLVFSSVTNRLQISGTNTTAINYSSFVQTNNNKVAYSYSASGVRLFVNGVLVGSNTDNASLPTNSLTTLDLALWNQTSAPFQGKVKSLITFNTALTDAELECLTTI